MAETPVIPREMTTGQDNPGDTSSTSPQEMTTVQDNVSTDAVDSSFNLQLSILLPFHLVISYLSLFGNLLLIWVVNHLPNSKLRKTTKVLMQYVSLSHCIPGLALTGLLLDVPCVILLLVTMNTMFNVQCGLAYLGYEVLVLVTKPYSHHNFISMNICMVGIICSCLASLCLTVIGYLIMKEPEDPFCNFVNGVFNPVLLCLYMGFIDVIILVTSTMQIFTLRAMKRVFPGPGTMHINVIHVAPVNTNAIHVAAVNNISPAATPGQNFPLKKLTKILTCSLLCSIICWLPSTISIITFSIFEMLQIDVPVKNQIVAGFSFLLGFNGILYVIVYLTLSSQIRQAVKKYLSSCICQNSPLFGMFRAKCNQ